MNRKKLQTYTCKVVNFLIVCTFLYSCSTTKYVPADKKLLNRNIVTIDNKNISEEEITNIIRQKPNTRFLRVFRLHLGFYNLSKPGSDKWFSRKFRAIGEEPVLYDPLLGDKTRTQIQLYLSNKGYFNAIVTDTLIEKNKEVKAYYRVTAGVPYKINSIHYKIEDTLIRKYVLADTAESMIKPGMNFDSDLLQQERERIENVLKNKAYFNFTKDYIYYEADTSIGNFGADIGLNIKNFQLRNDEGIVLESTHSRYKISSISVHVENQKQVDTSFNEPELTVTQMVERNNIRIVYHDGVPVKANTIVNNIYIQENQLYNQKNIDETYRALSALKVFRYINILFTEHASSANDSLKTVDCRIQLATVNFQSYQTDAEITNSSGVGVAGSFSYQHKNLFKGAELLNLKFKGATEAVKKQNEITFKNTLEIGTEASIQFPKFLLPFRTDEFIRKYNPKTLVSGSFNYMSRIQYKYQIANASFGYSWKGSNFTTYQVNPIVFNYVNILSIDPDFEKYIANTVQKYNFENHLLIPTTLSFTFNNQRSQKVASFFFFKFNFESAGNTIRQLSKLAGARVGADGNYELFGIPFAQYLKGDVDFRYYRPVNSSDKVVFRFFTGLAFPYGNSTLVPFEKQYYAGGANSIRAWQPQSLGPGSHKDLVIAAYPYKTSDIKIESNVEYRFKLFWVIEGALFFDVGNIWSINGKDERKDAIFAFDKFYNQLAVGTGIGTRFDFSFFIFRLDLGFKLRDPAEPAGYRWTFVRSVNTSFFNPTFGIGYPF